MYNWFRGSRHYVGSLGPKLISRVEFDSFNSIIVSQRALEYEYVDISKY